MDQYGDEFEEVMEDEIHANTASRSFDRRRKPDLILSAWALRGFVPFVYAHNCFWFMPVIFSNAAKENIPAFQPEDLKGKRICTDPFGSYTGLVTEPGEEPVQDADDL